MCRLPGRLNGGELTRNDQVAVPGCFHVSPPLELSRQLTTTQQNLVPVSLENRSKIVDGRRSVVRPMLGSKHSYGLQVSAQDGQPAATGQIPRRVRASHVRDLEYRSCDELLGRSVENNPS